MGSGFLDFKSAAGNNLIAEWYCGVSVECRAMFDTLLENLGKQAEWKYPDYKSLGDGLGEIRWKCDKKQHRVIGCRWTNPSGFLLLIGCTHKDQIYDPPDAINTADKRRRGIQFQNRGSTCVHKSPEDCEVEE